MIGKFVAWKKMAAKRVFLLHLFFIFIACPDLTLSKSFKSYKAYQLNGKEVVNVIKGKLVSDVSRAVAVRIIFNRDGTYIYRSAGGVMPIEKTGRYTVKKSGEACLVHSYKNFRWFYLFKSIDKKLFWRFGVDQFISSIKVSNS